MKYFLSLLFGGLFFAASAEEKTIVFEQSFPAGKELEFSTYVRPVPIKQSWIAALRNFSRAALKCEVEASGSSPKAAFGMKIKFFLREGSAPLRNLCWKQTMTDQYRKYVSEIPYDSDNEREQVCGGQLLVYNCTRNGTIKIRHIKLSATGNEEKNTGSTPPEARKIVNDGTVPKQKLCKENLFFPAGVYYYTSGEALRTPAGKENLSSGAMFDRVAADIAKHHCNTIYLSGISGDPGLFRECIGIAAKHGLRVIAQGNGVLYLRPERGKAYYESTTLPALRKTLPELDGLSNLIGFTIKEEVDPVPYAMELLRKARTVQREKMPHTPVFTLHNRLTSLFMDDDTACQPDWYAFDMYRFKLHPARKVIMTPSKAAYRIATNLEKAYLHTARFGRPLIFVAQGVREYATIQSNTLTRASGMKEVKPGVWRGYVRYLPKNAMNLQFWLGVMSGCRGILIYHYMDSGMTKALVDHNLHPTWYWEEFASCLKEAKPLCPLFASWYKRDSGEAATDVKTVWVRTFEHPEFQGTFILPVNTQIASWDRTNPRLTDIKTQLYSDEENLQGFVWAPPCSFRLLLKKKAPLWDLLTGDMVDPTSLSLPPGKGRVFFQGTKGELDKIRGRFMSLSGADRTK